MFIDQIFAVSGLRADHWRELLAIARRWQTGKAEGQDVKNALTLLRAVETLHAYPGPQLMTALEGYLDAGQKEAFVALASRISFSIVANYYKEDAREWEVNPDLSQARAELPGAAQHGPSSSTQTQDPREGPSLAGRMTQDLLGSGLAGQAHEERRYQGGANLARPS